MSFAKKLITYPWPAGMLAMVFSLLPLMGWISFILIGLMTLCRGPKMGLWVAVCAALPAIWIGFNDHPDVLLANAVGGCFYTWLAAVVFWYANSWTLVLEATLIFALLGIALIHILIPHLNIWWVNNYHEFLQMLQDQLASINQDTNDSEFALMLSMINESGLISSLARMTTGMVFSIILIFNLINLLLARLWQISAFNSSCRIGSELTNIRIGYVALIAMILTVVAILFKIEIAYDLLPIFLAIFFCSGLSLLHFLAGNLQNGTFLLVIFYALMIFFPTYIIPLLLASALIDTLIDVRKRT